MNEAGYQAVYELYNPGFSGDYRYAYQNEELDGNYFNTKLMQPTSGNTQFTGCDLNIFLNFTKIFKESKILKIENTYRNSQELIKLAGNFIMKNKNQLKKNLKSNKHEKYPINIIYYKNIETAFIKLINKIYKETKNPILIIGRNNFDINIITKNKNFKLEKDSLIYLNNKNIKMKYLTAHRSKGLEEENVILINLTNNKLGFPNKIENHEILNLITPKTEKYKYAEERRLFYVAITRTKNKNYLLVNKLLTENFTDVINVEFTANIENQFDSIAEGKENWI